MAVFKCKMCGGTLDIGENQSIATCEFCGTQQTLPKFDDERKVTLFTRANHLRFNCEFDKAAGVYESIVTEFPDEAEAYWGLLLCKFGIEYVDDTTGKKIPTCHRTLPTSIMDDEDFSLACDYADMSSKSIYREEAKAIDKIQKKILEIAATEKPYDIFICYKETDDNTGARTEDSAIAQDIYTELIKSGYKVFFARVTLREVAGTEYEPYIYAAISSAKVMLAIGTKYEYYDAIWVKNEWSRFISMMADDTTKALIPCFRNMDAYDMPKEFKNMQALDMGDVTFFASLTANINRFLHRENEIVTEASNIKLDKNREIAYEDGYYVGEAIADQPNGFGTRIWSNGEKYVGMWKFGKFYGKGEYTFADGDKYTGDFVDGQYNGNGIFCFADGDRYEGEFFNDNFHGQGIYYFANGDKFVGRYIDDEPFDGYGRVSYTDGYYIGRISKGSREGSGIIVLDDGGRYEGLFKNDSRNGPCVVTYANGDKFEGEYKDDEPYNGYGRKDYSDGYYIGQIVDGKREGKGLCVMNDGTRKEVFFKKDKQKLFNF